MLFPGQGCQYMGMCKELIQEFSAAKKIFEEADEVLGFGLTKLMLHGDMETTTLSENAQPAVVTASYALFRVFEEETGLQVTDGIGHSLGEISALTAAGAMSFSDAVLYARKRGSLMQSAVCEKRGRAGIVVDTEVKALTKIVDTICAEHFVTISGYNSPRQFIVAGEQKALRLLDDAVEQEGGQFIPFRMMPMKADAPYHTILMDYIKPDLEQALQRITFQRPKFNIWSTVTGEVIQPEDNIAEILGKQLITPVRWMQVLEKVHKEGAECFVDIGPNEINRNLVKENKTLPVCYAFDKEEDKKVILTMAKEGGN